MTFQTHDQDQYVLSDGDATTTENFLRLWLGKAADTGLEQLQDQLLKP